MAYNGTEGHMVDLRLAARWTKRYREENPGEVKAQFFGCDILNQLLNEPGCKGIRVYYGIDDDGKKQLILVGANAEQNNILPTDQGNDGSAVANGGASCPTSCPQIPHDPLTD